MKRYIDQYSQPWFFTVYRAVDSHEYILVAVVMGAGMSDIAMRLTEEEVETLRRSEDEFAQIVMQFLTGRDLPKYKTRRIESQIDHLGVGEIALVDDGYGMAQWMEGYITGGRPERLGVRSARLRSVRTVFILLTFLGPAVLWTISHVIFVEYRSQGAMILVRVLDLLGLGLALVCPAVVPWIGFRLRRLNKRLNKAPANTDQPQKPSSVEQPSG